MPLTFQHCKDPGSLAPAPPRAPLCMDGCVTRLFSTHDRAAPGSVLSVERSGEGGLRSVHLPSNIKPADRPSVRLSPPLRVALSVVLMPHFSASFGSEEGGWMGPEDRLPSPLASSGPGATHVMLPVTKGGGCWRLLGRLSACRILAETQRTAS